MRRAVTVKHRGGKGGIKKLPAAVALGRRGGVKGGPARARAISGAKRQDIAKHAANRRWGNKTSYTKPAYYKRKPYGGRVG